MITAKSPGLPNNRGFDHTCFVKCIRYGRG
jgi:hypothetical protein